MLHGYDEISVKILKASSHLISSPLTYICSKSLSTEILTEPLFKKILRITKGQYLY
jgi:hypothetical protein